MMCAPHGATHLAEVLGVAPPERAADHLPAQRAEAMAHPLHALDRLKPTLLQHEAQQVVRLGGAAETFEQVVRLDLQARHRQIERAVGIDNPHRNRAKCRRNAVHRHLLANVLGVQADALIGRADASAAWWHEQISGEAPARMLRCVVGRSGRIAGGRIDHCS
eukprot:2598011-Prymnesium_polylepis.1